MPESRSLSARLQQEGWALVSSRIGPAELALLGANAFAGDTPGTRCLLDLSPVHTLAESLRRLLVAEAVLTSDARAIQAIAFDKTATTNWKVTWHQDVMFPFAQRVSNFGYDLPSRKAEVDYARPPRAVLEALLAVRLHLDDCGAANGPLRVAAGSHREGVLKSAEIAERVARHGENVCLASAGDALLMKPLLLHASSPATQPRHRRVLHLVYYDGPPLPERWHREV
jgi:ectoine hydroxylase-related dioxygenase (phytanoyl-CoA dioxygenase family)